MNTKHTDARLTREDAPGAATEGLRAPDRASGIWRLMAAVEVAAAAVAVLADWLIPSLVLVGFAVLIPVTNHLTGTRQDVSSFGGLHGNLRLLVTYLAASWVLAAFCEETAFRGYLLTRLTEVLGRGRLHVAVAVLGSSLLFGLLHTEQGPVGVVAAALGGVVFSGLRYRSRTLWAPVLAHGFDDTLGFAWFFLFGPFYGLW